MFFFPADIFLSGLFDLDGWIWRKLSAGAEKAASGGQIGLAH